MLLLNDPIGNLLGAWSTSLTDAAILFRITLSIFFAAVMGIGSIFYRAPKN